MNELGSILKSGIFSNLSSTFPGALPSFLKNILSDFSFPTRTKPKLINGSYIILYIIYTITQLKQEMHAMVYQHYIIHQLQS